MKLFRKILLLSLPLTFLLLSSVCCEEPSYIRITNNSSTTVFACPITDEDHNEQHNGHRTRTSSVILPTENRFYASAVKIEPKECREIDVTGYYSWNKVLIVEHDQLKRHSWDEICEKRLYKLMSREKARWNDGYYIITYTGYNY